MGRNYRDLDATTTIAVGIEGNRHSLCGAIKRFEQQGNQWNSVLTLKERCARSIALIKNEQIRWFITAYLPPHLFQYVTKDLFDLRRDEFKSAYPANVYMCQECSMDTDESPPDDCRCPNMDGAIDYLNKYLQRKRASRSRKANITQRKKFELVYKRPNDGDDHSGEEKHSMSFFLYLSPVQLHEELDDDDQREPSDSYQIINGEISVEDKLLFIDAMRCFGGFRTRFHQPRLILYRRCEFLL